MSMSALIPSIVALALVLTYLCRATPFLPLSLATALVWLSLLIYVLIGGDANLDIGDTWVQALAFSLGLMVFVPLLLQTYTDIKHESSSWRKEGLLGKTQSYSVFERKPGKKESTSDDRQVAYKQN